jgi:hypothetical protein
MKRKATFVAIVTLISDLTSLVIAALAAGSGRDFHRWLVLGLGGMLLCAAQTSLAEPARTYDYTLEYALSPSDNPEVQRQQESVCKRMGPSRCRVMLSRVDDAGSQRGALTVEVTRATAPQVLEQFASIVDEAGGEARLRELRITGGSSAPEANGTASIAVTYIGIPGFAEQTGEALQAFGPVAQASLISTIFMLPALAPWLAVAALIIWGLRAAWRRRRHAVA